MGRWRVTVGCVAGVVLGLSSGAEAQSCHDVEPGPPESDEAGARVTIADAPLVDQDGRTVRFSSEVMKDRIVVIDFVYTTCTTVCPVQSAMFAKLRSRLGERVGRDVLLVSVSIDPVRDTPARLKSYAQRFGSGDGWVWLTGARDQVERVLQGFGATIANFERHPPMVLVGDARSGTWRRHNGLPDPELLAKSVDELLSLRTHARVGGELR